MAEIAPQSHIIICRNVPLDNTYSDTITFANSILQETYFKSKKKFVMDNCQYVRNERAIRVDVDSESLYDCNYIMWQNEGFGTKWFYAFITQIEYRNTGVSYLYFELDVMQTWQFDWTIHPCYVIREHINIDRVGANLVGEDVPLGPYVSGVYQEVGNVTGSSNIVVGITSTNETQPTAYGNIYNGVYQGVKYLAFNIPLGISSLKTLITEYTNAGHANSIVCMYIVPTSFLSAPATGTEGVEQPLSLQPSNIQYTLGGRPSSLNGYTPINNKLLTYPFCYMYMTSKAGSANTYRYELFNGAPIFYDTFTFLQPVERKVSPMNYQHPNNGTLYSVEDDEGIVAGSGPVCAWSFDSYNQYVNTNRNSITWGLLSDVVIEPANQALGGNPVQGIASSISSAISSVAKFTDMRKLPATLKGGLSTQCLNYLRNSLGIFVKTITITAEFARIIDDYFTMFGYATHELKIPNITGRPSWNYVQTQKAMITGSIPFNDISKIKSIFDAGVTFWHGDYVGDYSRNNTTDIPPDPPPEPSEQWGVPFTDWASHVTSEYGWRSDPITGESSFHYGIDIAYPEGTPIMAIHKGTVSIISATEGRGNYVDVKVDNSVFYRYQHCSSIDTVVNASVEVGQNIAKVGSTGRVTGPHLHLEIWVDGETVNPRPYLEGEING